MCINVKDNKIVVLVGEIANYTEKSKIEKLILENTDAKGIVEELKINTLTPLSRLDLDIIFDAIKTLKANLFVLYNQIKLIVKNIGFIFCSIQIVKYNFSKI